MDGYVLSTVATDALVLKAISDHSTDKPLCWTGFVQKYYI